MLCSEWDGIKPDITILGKALSGGTMPVSAVLADDEVGPPGMCAVLVPRTCCDHAMTVPCACCAQVTPTTRSVLALSGSLNARPGHQQQPAAAENRLMRRRCILTILAT